MPERPLDHPEDRVDQVVSDLLKGRRPRVRPADAAERAAIMAAARLAGARELRPRPTPAFRSRMASMVGGRERTSWMSRRAALVAGLGVAIGALSGEVLGRITEPRPVLQGAVQAPGPPKQVVIDPRPGRWVDVGSLALFPENQGVRVTAGALGAFVFRKGETVTAVSSICSHLPCELTWQGSHGNLNCPCHNRTFAADGTPTPSVYPLPPLPVVQAKIENGRVMVLGT